MTAVLDRPLVGAPSPAASTERHDFRVGATWGAVGLALAWPLGLVYVGWVIVGALALLASLRRRHTRFPRALAGWFVLLVLMAYSVLQVETTGRLVAFAYRYSLCLSATAICLYLYNSRTRFSLHRVMGVVAGLYVVVVLSGTAGLLWPDLLQPSLLLRALPGLPPEARFVVDTLTMRLAEVQNILQTGHASPRPKGVLAYTNDWGAVYTALTVVLLSYLQQQRRLNVYWLALAGLGLWPLLRSLDRGAWGSFVLGLGVALVVRLLRAGVRQVLPALVAVGVGTVVVLAGPAYGTIQQRFATHHSDKGRQTRVDEALTRVAERPLTGYGTPLPSYQQFGPSVGTHGELWLVLFSQGYPGAVVLVLFVLGLLAFAVRAGPLAEPLLAGIVTLAAQAFFYEWMALQLVLLLGLTGAVAAAAHHSRSSRPVTQ